MGKGDEAKDNAPSPEEMERLSRRSLDYQMEKIPLLQFDDIFSNSETAQNSLFGKALGVLDSMVDAGRASYEDSPARQLFSALAGERMSEIDSPNAPAGITETDPGPVFTPPEQSAYEKRIAELMQSRGMTRAEAVANQAHAAKLGTDQNKDGASSDGEWAMKLGADFDNSGGVTDQEWAQWKKNNPDHKNAGGTKYSGLPNQNGVFSPMGAPSQQPVPQQGLQTGGGLGMTPQAPRDRSYGTTMPAPGTQPVTTPPPQRHPQSLPMPQTGGAPIMSTGMPMAGGPGTIQPAQPVVGQPETNPQSPGKGNGQKRYVQ